MCLPKHALPTSQSLAVHGSTQYDNPRGGPPHSPICTDPASGPAPLSCATGCPSSGHRRLPKPLAVAPSHGHRCPPPVGRHSLLTQPPHRQQACHPGYGAHWHPSPRKPDRLSPPPHPCRVATQCTHAPAVHGGLTRLCHGRANGDHHRRQPRARRDTQVPRASATRPPPPRLPPAQRPLRPTAGGRPHPDRARPNAGVCRVRLPPPIECSVERGEHHSGGLAAAAAP